MVYMLESTLNIFMDTKQQIQAIISDSVRSIYWNPMECFAFNFDWHSVDQDSILQTNKWQIKRKIQTHK